MIPTRFALAATVGVVASLCTEFPLPAGVRALQLRGSEHCGAGAVIEPEASTEAPEASIVREFAMSARRWETAVEEMKVEAKKSTGSSPSNTKPAVPMAQHGVIEPEASKPAPEASIGGGVGVTAGVGGSYEIVSRGASPLRREQQLRVARLTPAEWAVEQHRRACVANRGFSHLPPPAAASISSPSNTKPAVPMAQPAIKPAVPKAAPEASIGASIERCFAISADRWKEALEEARREVQRPTGSSSNTEPEVPMAQPVAEPDCILVPEDAESEDWIVIDESEDAA